MGDELQPKFSAETPFGRIMQITKCRTQLELAAKLDIRQSSISSQMRSEKQQTVPPGWLITLLRKYGINPLWILYGSGPRFFNNFPPETSTEAFSQSAAHDIINNIKLITLMPEMALRYFTTTALMQEIYRRIVKTETAFSERHAGNESPIADSLAEEMMERDPHGL